MKFPHPAKFFRQAPYLNVVPLVVQIFQEQKPRIRKKNILSLSDCIPNCFRRDSQIQILPFLSCPCCHSEYLAVLIENR